MWLPVDGAGTPGEGDSALAVHARRIRVELQGLLHTLQHALDLTTCEARDTSSAPLATARAQRRENKQELQQEMDHWCRCSASRNLLVFSK